MSSICILGRSHRPKKANFKVWNAFFAGELCCEEIENYQKLVKRWLPCRDLPFWWLLYANELFDHFIGKVAFSMGSKINKNAKLKINVVNLNPFLMRKPLVTLKILYPTGVGSHQGPEWAFWDFFCIFELLYTINVGIINQNVFFLVAVLV